MKMEKGMIKNHFSRSSRSYDTVAHIQMESAFFLVSKLIENCSVAPKTILDLGAGTGYVSSCLMPYFPDTHYTLNDFSPEMIEVCRKKFEGKKNITFAIGDMEELYFSSYDVIISNLSFHWIHHLWQTILKFYDKSRVFSFSIPLQGTFREWHDRIRTLSDQDLPTSYPSEEEMVDYCLSITGEKGTFSYWTKDIPISFDHPLSFMKYLRKLGVDMPSPDSSSAPCALRPLVRKTDPKLVVTYKIFFALLKRTTP